MNPDWTFRWKEAEAAIPQDKIRELKDAFLLEFLEAALVSQPENVEVLVELGEIYTECGRLEDGLAVDRRLVRLLPDNPTVQYNLACSLALTGDKEKALKALEAALRRGFSEFKLLREDPDLDALRDEPEFLALLEMEKKALS